jgi:hypothetical protein
MIKLSFWRKAFLSTLLILLVSVASLAFHKGSASALTCGLPIPASYLPQACNFDQGNRVTLITAIYGNGYVLDSPISTVHMFSPNASNTLTVTNGGNCPGAGGDVGPNNSQATTTFYIYSLPPTNYNTSPNTPFGSSQTLLKSFTNKQIGCQTTYTVAFTDDQIALQNGSQQGKYGFEITAVMSSSVPGWNQFKLQISAGSGRLSYYAGSGDHFAVKAADNGTPPPGDAGDFTFGFAPGCKYQYKDDAGLGKSLKWFDADVGASNQPGGNIATQLIEYDNNNKPTGRSWNIPVITGNNQPGSYPFPPGVIQGHFKYMWVWRHIYSSNGIQFQLPFDSWNTLLDYNQDCSPPNKYSATCTASPVNIAATAPGQNFQITVTATNTSNTDWDPNASPTIRMQKNVSGTLSYVNLSASSTGGGLVHYTGSGKSPTTTKFTFNVTAPNAGQTKIAVFSMYQGTTAMSGTNKCTTTIKTNGTGGGPPPATPYMTTACDKTQVFIPKASITSKYITAAGTPVTITMVPVAIVIKETGNPSNTFTYTTHVDISGSNPIATSAPISTFGMWPAMLPHKSYDISLAVQGTQGDTSATGYNNTAASADQWYATGGNMASGPWWLGISAFPGDTVSQCLQVDQCNGGSAASLEAGQKYDFSYVVQFINLTDRSWPTSDPANYNFAPRVSGGLVYVGGSTPSSSGIPAGPGTVTDTVTLTIRSNYTGTYWVDFQYGNSAFPDPTGANPSCGGVVGQNTPFTMPYFQVTGGDISTGGGFKSANGSCGTASDTPYISPTSSGSSYAGGIRAFGYPNKQRGAEAQYGVDSLGLIIGSISGPIGFFSGNGGVMANKSSPAFTSIQGDGLYGYLNASPQAHCADEFLTTKQKTSPLPDSGASPDLTSLAGGEYQHNGDVDLTGGSAATIASGKQLTLFINGDVTIHNNINYAPDWDPNNQSSIPYLVIIAHNITTDNAVTNIDGLYVAQPTNSGDGQFNSCDPSDFCNNQLVINGAIIAQRVNFTRVHGSVGVNIDQDDDQICAPYSKFQCPPAEVIHYMPSMVLGGADLLQAGQGAVVPSGLEGVFSLPPVF